MKAFLRRFLVLASLALALRAGPALAQPAAPPPPKEYQVQLRYVIRATRVERIGQFFALTDYLESIGFKKAPGPEGEEEDPQANRMSGVISSANVRKILADPRVRSLLLTPPRFKLPEDADTPVKVQLELAAGLSLDRQRVLADQVRPYLTDLGFRESIGYDHRGHTRLLGTLPARSLDRLLYDQRWQGSGWLVPETQVVQLPSPLRSRWPVLVTEVVPEPEGVAPAKDVPAGQLPPRGEDYLLKITSEVRALPIPEGEAARPIRLEVILATTPTRDDPTWQRELLRAAPGTRIEGWLGQVVTVLARPNQAPALAQLPRVSTVRLPRVALAQVQPSTGGDPRELLRATGLERLHQQGRRGRGVRLAILDGDFRGWQALVGKQLPSATRLVDLTTERNPSIEPEPFAGDAQELGHGTQCALAAALAAPEAELILVRVDPAAPYMLRDVARWINGDVVRSVSLDQRGDELDSDTEELRLRRDALLEEGRFILNKFGQDDATVKRRQEYLRREAELERADLALQKRQGRFLQLYRDLQSLKGIHVTASTLVWNEGWAVDGSGPLTRFLDDLPLHGFWFQGAGHTRGQAWTGPFRDRDGNGVVEFAVAESPVRPDRWTHELNFLGWQPWSGAQTLDLPAQARVRVSVQWREPHEQEFLLRGEDLYRSPLADVRLLILRQRDPSGKNLGADEMEVVARSVELPQRLENQPSFATYEQTVEFTVTATGRFALRIEGSVPPGIRPASVPTIPAIEKGWELRPRVWVQNLDAESRRAGRTVFADHSTETGSLGMPGDARAVFTVGSADRTGQPQLSSARGPALGLELLPKPNLLAPEDVGVDGGKGPVRASVAAPFAAGLASAVLSAGMPPGQVWHLLHQQLGGLLRVPGK